MPMLQAEMQRLMEKVETLQAEIETQAASLDPLAGCPVPGGYIVPEQPKKARKKRDGHPRVEWDSELPDLALIIAVQTYALRDLPGLWLEHDEGHIDRISIHSDDTLKGDMIPCVNRFMQETERMYKALPDRIQCNGKAVWRNSCIDIMVAAQAAGVSPFICSDILNGLQHMGDMSNNVAVRVFGAPVHMLMAPDLPGSPNAKRKRALTMIKDRIKVFLEAGLIRDYGHKLHAAVVNPYQLKDKKCTAWIIERPIINAGELPF